MNNLLHTLLTVLLVCVGVSLLGTPAANAQEEGPINVAVLNLEGQGVEQDLLDTLTSVLRNEAQQYSDYDIVNQSSINLSELVVVLGCNTDNPTCLKQAAEQLEARVLIYGRVEKVEQAHRVTIQVFDARSGEFEQRFVRTLVNRKDPVVAFRKQLQSLFSPGEVEATTRLQIGSNVKGAKIKINDTMVGTTPLERKGLPPGRYRVQVYMDGYEPWNVTVELTNGADIRLWAPLDEASATTGKAVAGEGRPEGSTSGADTTVVGATGEMGSDGAPPRTGASDTNWGAWSAIGVGVAALGGSGAMALLMSNTEDDLVAHDANRFQMDRETYIQQRQDIVDDGESYELAHKVLLGVGAASVTAGTIWLLVDDESPDEVARRQWDVAVSPRGVSALWSW